MQNTGVKRWSAGGKEQVKPQSFPVLATGDYELRLVSKSVEARRSEEKGEHAVPYLGNIWFEPTDNDLPKSRLYTNFFLGTTPTKKGLVVEKGWVGAEAAGSILDFLQASGQDGNFECTIVDNVVFDKNGTSVSYLNPKEAAEFIKSLDGTVVRGHVKKAFKRGADGKDTDEEESRITHFLRG